MHFQIVSLAGEPVGARAVEVAERKGLGHPDTLCDAVVEQVSFALSRYYLEHFGTVLHYNVDKALLWGGAARPAFGGGEVLAPIEFYLAGRATREHRGVRIPVDDIAIEAARTWLKRNLHALDADRVRFHSLIRPSSADLIELSLRRHGGVALAGDTSMGVGFAPLDALERVILHVEHGLNRPSLKQTRPEVGEDVKIMGVRQEGRMVITLACALVGRHVRDLADYRAKKSEIAGLVQALAAEVSTMPVEVSVNAADGDTQESIYLTVTGTSAEAGDDGQAGRGNRVNGLITPYRPMAMEGVAGKNPVSHVGKLYNLGAQRLAENITRELAGVAEAYCYLVSRIGQPIDEPQVVDVQVRLKHGVSIETIAPRIEAMIRDQLSRMRDLWRELLQHERPVY